MFKMSLNLISFPKSNKLIKIPLILFSLIILFIYLNIFSIESLIGRHSRRETKIKANYYLAIDGHNSHNSSSYLVFTSNCQIIRWPTFDSDVIPLYENRSG